MADQFDLGRHEALIEKLSADVATMQTDIAWIRETLAEKRGERRVAVYFAAAGGGVVATILTYVGKHILKL